MLSPFRRSTSLQRPLSALLVVTGLVPLLLAAGLVGARTSAESRRTDHDRAQRLADTTADEVSRQFAEWRRELLVAAQDDVLKEWYRHPEQRGQLKPSIDAGLVGLHALFPDLIDEACYIDAKGPEEARQVRGTAVASGELSPDESGNPFFAPTLVLREGEVHQHTPYVSPDTSTWVVSNSTPILVRGHTVAILHFETELEGLRRQVVRGLPKGSAAQVVDSRSGALILQTGQAVPVPPAGADPDTATLPQKRPMHVAAGHLAASGRVPFDATNANAWVVEVVVPASPALPRSLLAQLGGLVLAVVLLLLAAGRGATRWLVQPLRRVTRQAERLAAGDLKGSAAVTRRDEIGQLAAAVDRATEQLLETVSCIRAESDRLAGVADAVRDVSDDLTVHATSATSVAGAMVNTASRLSTAADSLSSGVASLESGVEHIVASTGQAATMATEGARMARETTELMVELLASSATIDDVVKVIGGITDQTRLLALNASIEAARAGVHGLGFAVVAGEVKHLAEEANIATARIGERVVALQGDAGSASSAVDRIAGVITDFDTVQSGISTAVEDQAAVAHDMGLQVSGLAASTSQLARGSDQVEQSAASTRATAARTVLAAGELVDVSERMRALVARFRTR